MESQNATIQVRATDRAVLAYGAVYYFASSGANFGV